jgi:sec-independent protein translocase protein TatA
MNVGPLEILVVVFIVLLAFGGRKLPEAGRALGSGIRSLIDGVRGLHLEDQEPPPPAELEEPKTAQKPGAR